MFDFILQFRFLRVGMLRRGYLFFFFLVWLLSYLILLSGDVQRSVSILGGCVRGSTFIQEEERHTLVVVVAGNVQGRYAVLKQSTISLPTRFSQDSPGMLNEEFDIERLS